MNESEYKLGERITPTNVHALENYFRGIPPRTPQYDEILTQYFRFMQDQLTPLKLPSSISFPRTFYDRKVDNSEELIEAILEAATQQRLAVRDRGRGHYGQMGDYFWNEAEDLMFLNQDLSRNLWEVAESLGVDVMEWHKRVDLS